MKVINLNLVFISSISTTSPQTLHYPCSKEYSLESILYHSCIPAMCGMVTREEFLSQNMADNLMTEVHSLVNNKHKVFTAMDLHTHTMVREGVTEKMEDGRDSKLCEMLSPLIENVRMLVKKEFNTSTMFLSYPLVVSLISPGNTVVPYTLPHVDLYSYDNTAPHITAVLYLAGRGVEGGGLHIEGRGVVTPARGGLVLFTAGEENTHWVEEVTKGTRVAVTIFWSCDKDMRLKI